jgi:hypothetical protein
LPAFAVDQPIKFSGLTGRRYLPDLRPGGGLEAAAH